VLDAREVRRPVPFAFGTESEVRLTRAVYAEVLPALACVDRSHLAAGCANFSGGFPCPPTIAALALARSPCLVFGARADAGAREGELRSRGAPPEGQREAAA
jgi:hypothetical protein